MQSGRDKFQDIGGPYAPPPIPTWADANTSVDQNSERFKHREPGQYDGYYFFPDPGLISYANVERQQIYLRQLNHSIDVLEYRASSASSNSLPLSPQTWRDLLALAIKHRDAASSSTQSSQAFIDAGNLLGSFMRSQGVELHLSPPPSATDAVFDPLQGKKLLWRLAELNFRFELLSLDARLTHPPLPAVNEDPDDVLTNFRLQRQELIVHIFPGGSLVPVLTNLWDLGLAAPLWEDRCYRLQQLRAVMEGWNVPLPGEARGDLRMAEQEQGLKTEKALTHHYAQTFYDHFGRPAILPRRL